MEKKELEQVENKDVQFYFEHPFLSKRIEFIQEYDFESDKTNKIYFEFFILNFKLTANDWYNTLIIELSDKLNVTNQHIYEKYINYLNCKGHYLFKLSILDYFANQLPFFYKKYNINDFKELYFNTKTRYIIRNQILINHLLYCPSQKEFIEIELLNNMHKTDDYRSHIRIYNYIMNFELEKILDNEYLFNMIKITKRKQLGRAVVLKLVEFKEFLENGR